MFRRSANTHVRFPPVSRRAPRGVNAVRGFADGRLNMPFKVAHYNNPFGKRQQWNAAEALFSSPSPPHSHISHQYLQERHSLPHTAYSLLMGCSPFLPYTPAPHLHTHSTSPFPCLYITLPIAPFHIHTCYTSLCILFSSPCRLHPTYTYLGKDKPRHFPRDTSALRGGTHSLHNLVLGRFSLHIQSCAAPLAAPTILRPTKGRDKQVERKKGHAECAAPFRSALPFPSLPNSSPPRLVPMTARS